MRNLAEEASRPPDDPGGPHRSPRDASPSGFFFCRRPTSADRSTSPFAPTQATH